jgi:hypothetical protein
MTDDLRRDLFGETDRDQGLDAPLESDDPTAGAQRDALRTDDVDPDADQSGEGNPLLREGAGAPDAADIEDPERMI